MATPSRKDIRRFAKKQLGLEELRPGQEEAIASTLRNRDTLAVMPTGSGKSAIYQIAGWMTPGLTVVISPLIALQRDQVETLQEIDATSAMELNSTLSASARTDVFRHIEAGDVEFLFIAPEQLANDETFDALQAAGPSLVVVDEAHCVSEWGHDFRPEYLHLGAKIDELGAPTILALTATAAPPVQNEIVERLGMQNPNVIVQDFDRPNIHLAVRHFHDDATKRDALVDAVVASKGTGIVYVATRDGTEEIADVLNDQGVRASAYHAGLKSSERDAIQDAFMGDEVDVIVATIAFGMGIDKADVRFVYHHDISESVDSYYQEIGRAGRDGEPAEAILFYAPEDLGLRRFQSGAGELELEEVEPILEGIEEATAPVARDDLQAESSLPAAKLTRALDRLEAVGAVTIDADGDVEATDPDADREAIIDDAVTSQNDLRQYAQSRVEMMRQYADQERCRREFLLSYFDQDAPDRCGNCDNCEAGFTNDAHDESLRFPDNALVNHDTWGEGKVMRTEGETVTVRFDSVGYKTLAIDLVEKEGLLTLRDEGSS